MRIEWSKYSRYSMQDLRYEYNWILECVENGYDVENPNLRTELTILEEEIKQRYINFCNGDRYEYKTI